MDSASNLFTPGFGFELRFPLHHWVTFNMSDSNPDSDSNQLDSDPDSDSRKMRWIRIRVDSDSSLLDSDPDSDSRCPDSHITAKNTLGRAIINILALPPSVV